MSRTYKKPFTKSKAFDKSCRNHGGCPYYYGNRNYNTLRKISATKVEEPTKQQTKELNCDHPRIDHIDNFSDRMECFDCGKRF